MACSDHTIFDVLRTTFPPCESSGQETEIRLKDLCDCLSDVWEKASDLLARASILLGIGIDRDCIGSDISRELESESPEFVFSGFLLSIELLTNFQPDRASEQIGLFGRTVELEDLLYHSTGRRIPMSLDWPNEFSEQFRVVRNYTLGDERISDTAVGQHVDLHRFGESLFGQFNRNYILPRDRDERYELYIKLFCHITIDLVAFCAGYCQAMRELHSRSYTSTDHAADAVARVIVYARAIAAHGLKFDYAKWAESLAMR